MNTFNRTAITPSHWKAEKRKPANPGRAHVRSVIQQQRRNWSNQQGRPPIPGSRSGHGLEDWEEFLIQDSGLSVAELVVWTGRGVDEIIEFSEVLDDPGDDDDIMEME